MDPWGNEMYSAPIAMKFDPMATNSQLMKMKPMIYFKKSPFIHKSSIIYTSIRIHQYYKSLQQGSGEMELFLHCLTFVHEIFWYLHLILFIN